jgi:nucleotide-binding universal stress UspA family protein
MRAHAKGVTTTKAHPVAGDAADAILDTAESVGAGVIVVGNKGLSSKKRFLLGNVPSKVVHHSPCSTYVVHTT